MDNSATLLRSVLAQAMWLGTQLAARNYRGHLYDADAAEIRAGLERLRSSTGSFLDEARLSSVRVDEILPLYDEIQRVAAIRS